MASRIDNHNTGEGGAANRRRRRRRKKSTRTVGTQTCPSIAPNWYNVLDADPNAPSEREGVVRVDYYPDGDDPHMDDDWEYEQEEDEWESPWCEND